MIRGISLADENYGVTGIHSGHNVWGCDDEASTLYKFRIVNGELLRTISAPGSGNCHAIVSVRESDKLYLWVGDNTDNIIYKIEEETEEIVDEIEIITGVGGGLAWDSEENHLWLATGFSNKILEIDPVTKTIIKTFDSPGTMAQGIEYRSGKIYLLDNEQKKIWEMNSTTGKVCAEFDAPSSDPTDLMFASVALYEGMPTTDGWLYVSIPHHRLMIAIYPKNISYTLFRDITIRDSNDHISDITNCKNYLNKTLIAENTANQTVTIQIKGNREKNYEGAFNLENSFVLESNEIKYKYFIHSIPYIFIIVKYEASPTIGELNVWLELAN
jgi:hypothetical protein